MVSSRTSALASIAVKGLQSKPDGSYMVALGAPVQLMAMPARGDADGGESSYEWTATSGEIEDPTSMLATWTPAEPGEHEISVIVRGPAGPEATTSVVIEAANPVPALPLAWLFVLAVLLIRRGSRAR